MGSTIRVLIADDFEPWRRIACSTLQKHPGVQVISEVWDGLEAVQKAQEQQPDLILLDIGLPKLNGIEAARRIREHAPKAKILFLSENRSPDIAKEASRTGGSGYVVKSDGASDLLPAVEAVLQGRQFVSASLAGHLTFPVQRTGEPLDLRASHAPVPFLRRRIGNVQTEFSIASPAFFREPSTRERPWDVFVP